MNKKDRDALMGYMLEASIAMEYMRRSLKQLSEYSGVTVEPHAVLAITEEPNILEYTRKKDDAPTGAPSEPVEALESETVSTEPESGETPENGQIIDSGVPQALRDEVRTLILPMHQAWPDFQEAIKELFGRFGIVQLSEANAAQLEEIRGFALAFKREKEGAPAETPSASVEAQKGETVSTEPESDKTPENGQIIDTDALQALRDEVDGILGPLYRDWPDFNDYIMGYFLHYKITCTDAANEHQLKMLRRVALAFKKEKEEAYA